MIEKQQSSDRKPRMNGVLDGKEQRQEIRLDFFGNLSFKVTAPVNSWLPPSEEQFQRKEMPSARIKDVGNRGCCLLLDRPLEKNLVLKLDFPLIQDNFSIPTPAEVRWMRLDRDAESYQYRVGVRFLL